MFVVYVTERKYEWAQVRAVYASKNGSTFMYTFIDEHVRATSRLRVVVHFLERYADENESENSQC